MMRNERLLEAYKRKADIAKRNIEKCHEVISKEKSRIESYRKAITTSENIIAIYEADATAEQKVIDDLRSAYAKESSGEG
jgi:chromosome segregation ATPase